MPTSPCMDVHKCTWHALQLALCGVVVVVVCVVVCFCMCLSVFVCVCMRTCQRFRFHPSKSNLCGLWHYRLPGHFSSADLTVVISSKESETQPVHCAKGDPLSLPSSMSSSTYTPTHLHQNVTTLATVLAAYTTRCPCLLEQTQMVVMGEHSPSFALLSGTCSSSFTQPGAVPRFWQPQIAQYMILH